MTTVMNEKLARSYMKTLQDKLIKKVKTLVTKITTQDLVQMIFELLPHRADCPPRISQALDIIQRNQQTIIDNRCQIQYLRRKVQLEDQLTASFIKALVKDKNINMNDSLSKTVMKKQYSTMLNLPLLQRYDSSRIQTRTSRLDESIFNKSPIGSVGKRDQQDSSSFRYQICASQRSRITPCRNRSSQKGYEIQTEDKQKIMALKKLRKLQKYVFEKQNIHKDKSLGKIWNCGVSPSKKRYQQQNENLKVVQSSLVTHLTLLQKFRQVPSIQALVSRQQALKKKQKQLKDLSQTLQKKELQLNKRHSDFLKRQKSQKVL